MAKRLNSTGTASMILGPRGGRRRASLPEPWPEHAASVPVLSTVTGASGKSYAMFQVKLKDGNTWDYFWPQDTTPVVQSWDTVPLTGTSTFSPQSADGATWDAVASGPANSFSEGDGFFTWDKPAGNMHFTGTITGPVASREDAQVLFFNLDTGGGIPGFDLSTTPEGAWSADVMMPDGSATPVSIQDTVLLQTSDGTTLTMTGTGFKGGQDFWLLYQTFKVLGYPGQWFGEWFNAVAWGAQVDKVADADLAAWLAAN